MDGDEDEEEDDELGDEVARMWVCARGCRWALFGLGIHS